MPLLNSGILFALYSQQSKMEVGMPEEKIQKNEPSETKRLKKPASVTRVQTAEGWKRKQLKMRRSAKSAKTAKS